MLLGDFNPSVSKSNEADNIIRMFGEATCNSSGNLLFELLHNCDLMICNERTMLTDPQWTQVQNCLGYKSIIDHIITDKALMKELSNVFVAKTDISLSDHYSVLFDYGRNFVIVTHGWRLKQQTNGNAITVSRQRPTLDSSIERDQIA